MLAKNRFFRKSDFKDEKFDMLRREIEVFYKCRMRGMSHDEGTTAEPGIEIVMHWSRVWEYPWAMLAGNVKENHIILDAGCGGSPLLPYLTNATDCLGYGIDIEHGDYFVKCQEKALNRIRYLCNLKRYYVDPQLIFGDNPAIEKGDITDLRFPDNFFDRVFCISVIEHFDKVEAKRAIEEMVRVLKPSGKLIITTDYMNPFRKQDEEESFDYKDIIGWSELDLDGESDFSIPHSKEVPGKCHVVGFVLRK